LTSFHSNETLYELGFKCPKHPDDDHLVINRPMPIKGVKASSQSAKFLWLNFHEKKSIMFCLGREIRIDLPSSAQYLDWFEKVSQLGQPWVSPILVMRITMLLHVAGIVGGEADWWFLSVPQKPEYEATSLCVVWPLHVVWPCVYMCDRVTMCVHVCKVQ